MRVRVIVTVLVLAAGCSPAGVPSSQEPRPGTYEGLATVPPVEGAVAAWEAGGRVETIRAVSADEVWVRTRRHRARLGDDTAVMRSSGLYRLADDGTMPLAYAPYRDLSVDSDGTAWRDGGNGLLRFEAGEWSGAALRDPRPVAIRDGTIWSVGEDPSCEIGDWITPNELYREDADGMTHWTCDAFPLFFFDDLFPAADGAALVLARTVDWERSPGYGFGERVMYWIDDEGVSRFDVPDELTPALDSSDNVHIAPNGDVWLASFADREDRSTALVGRFDGATWHTASAVHEFGMVLPVQLFEDRFSTGRDGRAWAAAGPNLAVFDRGRWSKVPVDGGGVISVSVAPDGAIWVGIRSTIHRFPPHWPALSPDEPSKAGGERPWLFPLAIALGVVFAVVVVWSLRKASSAR
jgi:hypothetical protein